MDQACWVNEAICKVSMRQAITLQEEKCEKFGYFGGFNSQEPSQGQSAVIEALSNLQDQEKSSNMLALYTKDMICGYHSFQSSWLRCQ